MQELVDIPTTTELKESLAKGLECTTSHKLGGLAVLAGATGKIVGAKNAPFQPVNYSHQIWVDWKVGVRTYIAFFDGEQLEWKDPYECIRFIGYEKPAAKNTNQLQMKI